MAEAKDKRKTRRFATRQGVADVRTCFLFFKSGTIKCELLDLSRRGARIVTSKKLKNGQTLEVLLRPSEGEKDLSVTGQVAWCQTGKQAKYHAGIRFTNFKNGAYDRLRQLEEKKVQPS